MSDNISSQLRVGLFQLLNLNAIADHYAFFANEYSKLAIQPSPLTALNNLDQSLEILKKDHETNIDNIASLTKQIFRESDIEDAGLILISCYKISQRELKLPTIIEILDGKKSSLDRFKTIIDSNLKEEHKNDKRKEGLYTTLQKIIEKQERITALNIVIKYIIHLGFPEQINSEITEKETKQEIKRGRPYDEENPQEKIEKLVLGLAKNKEFKHKNGKPKPTKIRDELLNYSEITLGQSRLYERVKEALEKHDLL